MSAQQESRGAERSVLQADRMDDAAGLAPPRASQVVVVHRGAGRGTTVIAGVGLLAALAALVVPVGAPLLDEFYPEHPLVKALNKDSRSVRAIHDGMNVVTGRLAAQTTRIEAIEAGLTATAERLGRIEARSPVSAAETSSSGEGAAAPVSTESRLGQIEQHFADLAAKVAAVEPAMAIATKRIDALDTIGSNGKTFSARMEGVETHLTGLGTTLTELAAQTKAMGDQLRTLPAAFEEVGTKIAGLDTQLAALEQRLTGIEAAAKISNASHKGLRLGVALLQLNNITQTHRPYSRELATVMKLWQPVPVIGELEVLGLHADSGVATVAELRDSFSVILAPKLRSQASGGDRPFVDRMRLWVSSWVAPQGGQTSQANPIDLAVDAAIEKLAEDDVRGAIDHLGGLEGAPATLASRWIVEAKNRLAIDRAMDALRTMSTDDLARPN